MMIMYFYDTNSNDQCAKYIAMHWWKASQADFAQTQNFVIVNSGSGEIHLYQRIVILGFVIFSLFFSFSRPSLASGSSHHNNRLSITAERSSSALQNQETSSSEDISSRRFENRTVEDKLYSTPTVSPRSSRPIQIGNNSPVQGETSSPIRSSEAPSSHSSSSETHSSQLSYSDGMPSEFSLSDSEENYPYLNDYIRRPLPTSEEIGTKDMFQNLIRYDAMYILTKYEDNILYRRKNQPEGLTKTEMYRLYSKEIRKSKYQQESWEKFSDLGEDSPLYSQMKALIPKEDLYQQLLQGLLDELEQLK